MGNYFFQGNCCEVRTIQIQEHQKYNQIHPIYTENINFLETMQKNIPRYKNSDHSGLVNYLQKNNIKFQDKFFPVDDAIGIKMPFKVQWKRLCEAYPNCKIVQNNQYTFFGIPKEYVYTKQNFVFAMQKLMRYPSLLQRIFPNKQIREEGFYALYFGIHGDFKERTEIIIDDFIPLGPNGQYLFGKSKQNIVWTILVEKALAKVIRSFHAIKKLTAGQIFQEITGVPLLNHKEIIFHERFYLNSQPISFPPQESTFFKFTITKAVKVAFLIWERHRFSSKSNTVNNSFVMELINEETVSRILYAKNFQGNKLFLLKDKEFLKLGKGTYVIHVFNRSEISETRNMLVYASERVDIHLRKESYFQDLKQKALVNLYMQIHSNIQPEYKVKDIAVRYNWDGHRAFLSVKNQSKQKLRIQVSIVKIYEKLIFFEEDRNKKSILETCGEGKTLNVCLLRRRDVQIRSFFNIDVYK